MRRTRYQQGSLQLDRRTNKWYYRWREKETGKRRAELVGTLKQFPTQARAWRAAEPLRANVNREVTPTNAKGVTVAEVAEKYIGEEMPPRFSTRKAYLCNLQNHIVPKWGDREIASLQPSEVEQWLKGLAFSSKTKTHIRNLLGILVNSAMRRGYLDIARNPIELVRIQGGTRRKKRPAVLTMTEFAQVLAGVPEEPFRTMVLLAMCLGLRSCEVVGLQWQDVDWHNLVINIRRGVVDGRVGEVKTDRSQAGIPLDPAVAEILLTWKRKTTFAKETDWIFASPLMGGRLPYLAKGIQQNRIGPAMIDAGFEKGMGWHTFRHTYRTLLSATGAPLDVQRDLMRHASITTTMDVYGDSMPEPMRAANSLVVKMVPK